ncbi:MAG: LysR family transcriptional regulator [Pseudomonadota bacterium]
MSRMDKIDRMRAFAAVARENSFAAAARRLGLSARLVSKYVADLEGSLDARLLNRTTRSVSLTDVGAAYLAQCEPLLDGFDELEETVRDRQTKLRGLIRLTAPTGFGATRLADALSRFIERNPLVQLELKLSDQHVAIVDEGIDLAIRIGVMRDSSLIARRLTPMPLLVVAAPAYLARRGAPDHPRALATHECVTHSEDPDADLWRFAIGEREEAVRVGGAIKGNSPAVAARFAIAGLAIARCPRLYGRRRAGRRASGGAVC